MAFVGRRLLHSIFVLWAVATILFLMFRLMPGNPLAAYMSEALSAEQQNLIMQQFGLDRPLWEQYVIYFGNLVQGELGTSFHRREPVLSIVLSGPAEDDHPDLLRPLHRLRVRHPRRRLPRLAPRHLDRGRGRADRARDAGGPRVLARHDPSRGVRVLARLVPVGRREQRRAMYAASSTGSSRATSSCT